MFSSRECMVEGCSGSSVTGSNYCFEHIEDPEKFMKKTIAMLSDCDRLHNFILSNAKVNDIKIPCRSIITSKFSETVFHNVVFDESSIRLCFFDFCEFYNCSFTSADIRYSVFSGSVFSDCSFKDSEVLHTNFSGAKFLNGGFFSCDLYYSSFISSGLQDVSFRDCNLKKVSYLGSNRYNVDFKYSNHEEAEFDKGRLR